MPILIIGIKTIILINSNFEIESEFVQLYFRKRLKMAVWSKFIFEIQIGIFEIRILKIENSEIGYFSRKYVLQITWTLLYFGNWRNWPLFWSKIESKNVIFILLRKLESSNWSQKSFFKFGETVKLGKSGKKCGISGLKLK